MVCSTIKEKENSVSKSTQKFQTQNTQNCLRSHFISLSQQLMLAHSTHNLKDTKQTQMLVYRTEII